MGTTAEDMHRGLSFKGPANPLNQNRCLVILEEQNEDCDDDLISEEEDKRLMEGRNRGVNEDRSEVNSSRSSASNECWNSTYRKLRRASELIGASAVAIDNKIEMAMDLVKNHLMYAVREEMDQMRNQIRELTERNKQLEEENIILKASTSPDNLDKIFNPHSNQKQFSRHLSTNDPTDHHRQDMTERWLSNLSDRHVNHQSLPHNVSLNMTDTGHDRRRKGATLFPLSPHFGGQVLASPTIGVTGIHLSPSPNNDFSPRFVQQFHPTQFAHSYEPQVSSDVSTMGSNTPRFIFIKPDGSPDGYNMAWTPTNDYSIIQFANPNIQHQLKGQSFQK